MALDPYGSHLPILLRILTFFHRDICSILEIGCGHFSTPLLHLHARLTGGPHLILESNEQWALEIGKTYGVCVASFIPGELPPSTHRPFDFAFIDNAIESTRSVLAFRLHSAAKIIVLHDSNPDWEPAYHYSSLLPHWKYHRNFNRFYPNTLILTNNDEVGSRLASL